MDSIALFARGLGAAKLENRSESLEDSRWFVHVSRMPEGLYLDQQILACVRACEEAAALARRKTIEESVTQLDIEVPTHDSKARTQTSRVQLHPPTTRCIAAARTGVHAGMRHPICLA